MFITDTYWTNFRNTVYDVSSASFNRKIVFPRKEDSILKMRLSSDRRIFKMGITILAFLYWDSPLDTGDLEFSWCQMCLYWWHCKLPSWASYQIRKIVGYACAGNAGNVFPVTDFKGNLQLAILACITACGGNDPSIPGACATRNFTCLVRGPWHPVLLPVVTKLASLQLSVFSRIIFCELCDV